MSDVEFYVSFVKILITLKKMDEEMDVEMDDLRDVINSLYLIPLHHPKKLQKIESTIGDADEFDIIGDLFEFVSIEVSTLNLERWDTIQIKKLLFIMDLSQSQILGDVLDGGAGLYDTLPHPYNRLFYQTLEDEDLIKDDLNEDEISRLKSVIFKTAVTQYMRCL